MLTTLCSFTPFLCPGAGSVLVDWTPSPNPEVTGYNVYYGVASQTYTNMLSVGNATNATITGLIPGVTYYFAATATDGTGLESDFSNEAFILMPFPASLQPPTLNAVANFTIAESAGAQTVNLAGITAGDTNTVHTLVVTATSGNTSLIPDPTVSYTSPSTTGLLTFTPVPFAYGSTTISVTVNNGAASNNIVTRTFLVTVSPVNQAPTLNILPSITINENSGAQTVNLSGITSGAGNENQTLTVTASSGNPGLIPDPTVSYLSPNTTGTLSFTPLLNTHGQAVITVTVNDGGSSNNVFTRSFTVTVNQRPTISTIADLGVTIGLATPAISFVIGDTETAAGSLTLSGASSNATLVQNTGIVFGGSGASRTVIVTPQPGKSGAAIITVTVSDGLATSTSTFHLSVKPAPPGNFRVTVP